MPAQVVKVAFDPSDISALDRDAAIQGVSRAELIRNRTLNRNAGSKQLTPTDYHRVISEAAAYTRGAIDRHQLEAIVAFTINKVFS
jgi:hypothetical protein